ncbi:MAG: transcription elongation factor GreA [Gammaproteobacteria bacterium]|jgi:transcription elongation factor GreA
MSGVQTIPMTVYGAKKLQDELHKLKTQARVKIIEAIKEARSNGDLKENADYHAAKEQQGFIEGRIIELEHKLSHCQVIDVSKFKNDGKIIFGSTITLVDQNDNKTVTYQIVGDGESDLKYGKISVSSPIARALIGKFEDDIVDVNTPSGIVQYKIEKVEYI